MTIRTKLVAYLVVLHLVLAGAAVWLVAERRWLLIPLEILLLVSLVIGARLIRSLLVPLDLVRTGAELIAERDFSTHFREVGQDEMDALVRTYNTMIDRLREERLRLEEQHLLFQKVIAAAPVAFLTCDWNGKIDQLNPEAETLFAIESGRARGTPLADLPHPLAAPLAKLEEGESEVLAQGGRKFRGIAATFVDRGFERRFYLVEELTRELQASERAAYEKLIRIVSHEVGNSVGAVGSLLESGAQLGDALPEPERGELAHILAIAVERLRALHRFTEALAELVRIPRPAVRDEDVAALLRDIVTLVRPDAESRGVALAVEIENGGPIIAPIDRNQMERVLLNVLRNAIDASVEAAVQPANVEAGVSPASAPAGSRRTTPRVEVHVSKENNRPTITIRDTGPGVPAEASEFTPFFTTKPHGQGLGLALVREILAQHGFTGALRTHPEGGAEFRIEL